MIHENNKIELVLVDDNPGDVRLFKECLEQVMIKDYVLTIFDNAHDLEKHLLNLEKNKPNIIFLDLNLPKKNGKEVLKWIKKDLNLRDIVVLVLTTSDSEIDKKDCFENYANAFLIKPFDYSDFVKLIESFQSFWLNPFVELNS